MDLGKILLVIGAVIGGVLALALAIAIVLACAVLTAAALMAWLPAQYFRAMGNRLAAGPVEAALAESGWLGTALRMAGHVDRGRSLPHYFFGPVEVDVKSIIKGSSGHIGAELSRGWGWGRDLVGNSTGEGVAAIGIVPGAGILIGFLPGALCGIAVTAVVAVVHVTFSLAGAGVSALTGLLLRGVDAGMRYAAGIHLTCPICARAVSPYAAYRCPKCGELHRDIRPGRRGIAWRVCTCGYRMPTTLVFMKAMQLAPVCPQCRAGLPRRFGKIPIIVIPFFGSVTAGKTQLIYTLISALEGLITGNGGTVEIHGDTRHELDRIGQQLSMTGSPRPTVAKAPEAFVLRIKIGLNERYIYLFDPAGELHYTTDRLDELQYFDKADTLIFVADPLAADEPWGRLSAEQQSALAPIRSEWAEAERAYELPREQMRHMGSKANRMRLGFVITKKDVFTETASSVEDRESVRKFVAAPDGMGMGNIVREAERAFGDVDFFWTAAKADDGSDAPDAGVEKLARWLLTSEGIIID